MLPEFIVGIAIIWGNYQQKNIATFQIFYEGLTAEGLKKQMKLEMTLNFSINFSKANKFLIDKYHCFDYDNYESNDWKENILPDKKYSL